MDNRTDDPVSVGNERLLLLASMLDAADEAHIALGQPTYAQDRLAHRCGTPACAGGHWDSSEAGQALGGYRQDWRKTFALNSKQEEELFGSIGCGNARSAKDAAAYIRSFVERRRG